ncbi:ATP synthase F1 subunit delta [Limosilactobacillus sp.]|uniref:ATP synthase F1 subunit delta n=1 Tax=Limosilactobacillus sp. TaxID=2773925 RepID=UPI00345EA5EB
MSLDKMEVGRRYSKALFELVEDDADQLKQTYQELQALRQVFTDNPALVRALTGVDIPYQDKKAIVEDLKQGASQYVANLVQMTFDYGRIGDMVAIIDEFGRRYDEQQKRVRADVVTAVKLDATRRDRLIDALKDRFGAKEVILKETVDPTILGGVIIKTANQTLDGSLSSKIEQIRRLLVK